MMGGSICLFVIVVAAVSLAPVSDGNFTDFGDYSGDYDNFFGDSCNDHGNLPTSYRGDMAVTQTGLQCMEWNRRRFL